MIKDIDAIDNETDALVKADTWQNRIKERLKFLGMTQEALARKIGVTRSAITHYLAGRRVPTLSQFEKIAKILEANPAWLQFGSPDETTKEKVARLMPTLHPVPILTWEQAAEFEDIRRFNLVKMKDWVPNYFSQSTTIYGLKIKGDAMVSPSGQIKSFHEGDIIVISHNGVPKPGDFVVAKLEDIDEINFKQFVEDGGRRYLKPLNPQYPTVDITNRIRRLAPVLHCISLSNFDPNEFTVNYSGSFSS